LKDAEKAVEQQKRNELLAKAGNIVGKPTLISDLKLFAFAAELDLESLRELVSRTKGDNPDAVVVALTSTLPAGLIIGLGDRAISEILDARKLLAAITAQFGGKGGGKPEMTQGSLSADAKPSVVIEQLPNVIASLK
jgi:alanyl-tRNA synthetase